MQLRIVPGLLDQVLELRLTAALLFQAFAGFPYNIIYCIIQIYLHSELVLYQRIRMDVCMYLYCDPPGSNHSVLHNYTLPNNNDDVKRDQSYLTYVPIIIICLTKHTRVANTSKHTHNGYRTMFGIACAVLKYIANG